MFSRTGPQKTSHRSTTAFRWKIGRARRRRLTVVRLGGEKPRRRFSFARACRKVKLTWMKAKHSCMLKKLKKYYASIVKDLMEGAGTPESFHQMMLMGATNGIPVFGPVIC